MVTVAASARLFDFVGYGPLSNKSKTNFLIIGEKEYTPKDTEWDNCQIRLASFRFPWEDKNEALKHLARGFASLGQAGVAHGFMNALDPGKYFAWQHGAPSSVAVWTWAALFVTAWRCISRCTPNGAWFTKWAQEYRDLGTPGSDVALTELYPLPMRSVTAWPPEYHREFGDRDSARYFQRVFPLGTSSPRRSRLDREALARLDKESIAIGYGRGGNQAEFWQRYDALFAPRPSMFNGASARWHSIVPKQVEIGISERGWSVARVGFPWGRPNANPVTQEHIPHLVEALRTLRVQNP